MAQQQFPFVIAQMKATPFTIAPKAAVLAVVALHPFVIAMRPEAMLPNIHEVILVDVPLAVVIADASAGADAAIYQDRSHRDAC